MNPSRFIQITQHSKSHSESRVSACALVLCIAVTAVGCGTNRRYANNVIRQLPHSNIHIDYTWSEQAEVTAASSPAPSPGTRTLSVVYPHPNDMYGRKYAEVTLQPIAGAEQGSSTAAVTELLTNPFKPRDGADPAGSDTPNGAIRLAVPREELEFLLRELVADSYFDRESRPGGGVDMKVTLGGRTTAKAWDRVAGLERLATRVIAEQHKNARSNATPARPAAVGAELLAPYPAPPDDSLPSEPAVPESP